MNQLLILDRTGTSSEADIRELVQKAIVTYGKLDCAFNNAGIDLAVKPLHEQSSRILTRLF